MKPLGKSVYGSIPYLLKSKLGPSEHHIDAGQDKIATVRLRDKYDVLIVQEKLDGSCVSIAKHEGELLALTRKGYSAQSSPHKNHQLFFQWFDFHKHDLEPLIEEGERVVGEWLYQKHSVSYTMIHPPFVAFDLIKDKRRMTVEKFYKRFENIFPLPAIVHHGDAIDPVDAFDTLIKYGSMHGADVPEGLVYRVERKEEVDFLAKWVRPDFESGKFSKGDNFEINNFMYSW